MNHFQTLHAFDAWEYENGKRGKKKVHGYVGCHGLHIYRPGLVGFVKREDGPHVFLIKNAGRLGYIIEKESNHWANLYKDADFMLEVTDQNGRKGYVLPENVRWD